MTVEKIKVIIADDDPPSRMILAHFTELLPEYEVIAEAANGEELIRAVVKERPDLALVDINMPGINGIDAVKACKDFFPAMQVIFTTGHDEFAVDAFNIAAVDYIVKPIERSRLLVALEKTKRLIQGQRNLETKSGKNLSLHRKLAIKSNNMFLYLSTEDILYIEKEGRKTLVHLVNDQYETTDSLLELEGKLPEHFYKTHRSFLVNLKNIIKVVSTGETYSAHFTGTDKVAYISKLKINEVYGLLG